MLTCVCVCVSERVCGKSLGLLEERIGSCTGFSSYFKQNVEKHISAAVSRSYLSLTLSLSRVCCTFVRLLRSFGSLSSVLFRVLSLLLLFGLVLYVFVCFCSASTWFVVAAAVAAAAAAVAAPVTPARPRCRLIVP